MEIREKGSQPMSNRRALQSICTYITTKFLTHSPLLGSSWAKGQLVSVNPKKQNDKEVSDALRICIGACGTEVQKQLIGFYTADSVIRQVSMWSGGHSCLCQYTVWRVVRVWDEHKGGEEARFVPWGVLVDCVSHRNRCSTTWATQGHRSCVWDAEWVSQTAGLQLMQILSALFSL